MDQETLKQFAEMLAANNEAIFARFDKVESRIDSVSTELGGRIDGVEKQLHALDTKMHGQDEKFDAVLEYIQSEGATTRSEMKAYIENTTNKQIEVLFDGYTGTQERISIMQKQIDGLTERMQQLEDLVKSMAS